MKRRTRVVLALLAIVVVGAVFFVMLCYFAINARVF